MVRVGDKVRTRCAAVKDDAFMDVFNSFDFVVTSIENGLLYNREEKIYAVNPFNVRILKTAAHEETNIDIKPIVSDGKSSSYYNLKLNKKTLDFIASNGYVITEMLINDIFDNDFDAGNAFKSLVRAWGTIKGSGKAGNSIEYELNKIEYSINKIREYRINKD